MINTKEDLRIAFITVKLFQEIVKKYAPDIDPELEEKRNEYIRNKKKEIRDFLKKKSDRRLINESDYGSYTELIELPDFIESKEEATEYFEEEEWRHYYPSPYDCTGQWFTSGYKVFQRRGKWMAYHRMCCDC